MEQWQQVTVTLNTVDSGIIDLFSYELFEMEAQGVQVKYAHGYLENHPNLFGEISQDIPESDLNHPVELHGYFNQSLDIHAIKEQLDQVIPNIVTDIAVESIPDQNWQENWMKYYHFERITRHIVIVPEWENYQAQKEEQVIYLDPGIAFGTGNHPTTQLSGQALDIFMKGGERVLDIGTGSGILSFIAGALGASQVHGYDLDPDAVKSAQANLELQRKNTNINTLIENNQIDFKVNNLLQGVTESADIIIANILPHILVDLFEDAYKLLEPDGYLIIGGILTEKGPEIETAIHEYKFEIIQKIQMKNWLSYVIQKEELD